MDGYLEDVVGSGDSLCGLVYVDLRRKEKPSLVEVFKWRFSSKGQRYRGSVPMKVYLLQRMVPQVLHLSVWFACRYLWYEYLSIRRKLY